MCTGARCRSGARRRATPTLTTKPAVTRATRSASTCLLQLNEHAVNLDLIVDTLAYIDEECDDGAVLVFLSGIGDITSLLGQLLANRRFADASKWRLLPLHSSLSPSEQSAVFEHPPPGVRKVPV